MGGGSNLIVSDKGFKGIVIKLTESDIKVINHKQVLCSAGVQLDNFVNFCIKTNLWGVEALSGIPGTVGGGIVQNAGAYGQELKDTISNLEVLDTSTFEIVNISKENCQFEYRGSRFKGKTHEVVTKATFNLSNERIQSSTHKELETALQGKEISPQVIREEVIKLRRTKSMIWDIQDKNSINSGSFFVNPIISTQEFAALQELTPETIPNWPLQNQNLTKISAGWLIEHSGYPRGFKYKGVGLSEKTALSIINCGNGTASDIRELGLDIQKAVNDKFNIYLKFEVIFLGFD